MSVSGLSGFGDAVKPGDPVTPKTTSSLLAELPIVIVVQEPGIGQPD